MSRKPKTLGFERYSGAYLLGAFILVFSLISPNVFGTMATLHGLAAQKSVVAILAFALVVPLVCGVYDLSVGANINFTTITVVTLISNHWSIPALFVQRKKTQSNWEILSLKQVLSLKATKFALLSTINWTNRRPSTGMACKSLTIRMVQAV